MLLAGSVLLSFSGRCIAEELPAKSKSNSAPVAAPAKIIGANAGKPKLPVAAKVAVPVSEPAPEKSKDGARSSNPVKKAEKRASDKTATTESSSKAPPSEKNKVSEKASASEKGKNGAKAAEADKGKAGDKALPAEKAKSSDKSNANGGKDTAKNTEHVSKHKHLSAGATGGLVPPPPPTVPTMSELGVGGAGATMIFVGENIDYLPASELHDVQQRTDKEIERYRERVDDLASSSQEKQQKSGQFDQLFTEGVVSRRELETCKKEAEKSVQDLDEAKQTLNVLEQKHIKIEQRLAFLTKTKKPSKSPHRK